jgi:hypothetical protein
MRRCSFASITNQGSHSPILRRRQKERMATAVTHMI